MARVKAAKQVAPSPPNASPAVPSSRPLVVTSPSAVWSKVSTRFSISITWARYTVHVRSYGGNISDNKIRTITTMIVLIAQRELTDCDH